MRKVSEGAQDLLSQLVVWELLGAEDLDPKALLRQVPLTDLSVVAANVEGSVPIIQDSVSARMVMLELHYRLGHLGDDWSFERKGLDVTLNLTTKKPLDFIHTQLTV